MRKKIVWSDDFESKLTLNDPSSTYHEEEKYFKMAENATWKQEIN